MHPFVSKYFFFYPVTFLHGENISRYLSRYKKFQYSDSQEIAAYQLKYLKKLLIHAQQTVPYYRDLFNEIGFDATNLKSISELKALPALTKPTIIKKTDQMRSASKYFYTSNKTTGGSTGQTVSILKNADALARERAATLRAYEWAGVAMGDPQARFWGIPLSQKNKLLYKAIDFISNRKRFSAFNITPNAMEEYYRSLLTLKPVYFYGYASILKEFASFVIEKGFPPLPSLRSIITTSEVLTDNVRELLERAFKCPVFNEYGCGEVGSIAHECEYHKMHIMSDNLIVEIESDTSSNGTGEILVTDLFNYAMPLIRYRVGDYATLSNETCECGRTLPLISKIHGRAYDFIVSPDNKKHHPELLMYIFEELKQQQADILQFQVVQLAIDKLDIFIVRGDAYADEVSTMLVNRIHEKINSDFDISITFVESIKREASGKLRLIKGMQNN